ncbi:hypothetical protein NDU88_006326 [Pleurodeles waltl]|uniref:Telomere repeats-binding bouquet formation protein 2 n=1 Tax=Pleurodeles waltl TaxID=8319 RepID=A0AAV7TY11_PLEWA|nr:hypothetical protein NDU88_006326 [Pleurodeles waltl]
MDSHGQTQNLRLVDDSDDSKVTATHETQYQVATNDLAPVNEGGVITNHLNADYLFSSDASHPDTLSIYGSIEYAEDRATVFHSSYLSAVARSEIRDMVALGHFILPPACLQKEIRRQIGSFIWEQDRESLIKPESEITNVRRDSRKIEKTHLVCKKNQNERKEQTSVSRMPVLGKLTHCPLQSYPVNNMVTGKKGNC